jgi:catechol 2,3-dioxygenase-like lactoylglutathione lyase family enzyme
MVSLTQAIPALPVRDAAAAVAFYRDRLGFEVLHHDGGFAVLCRDEAKDVLHPVSRDGVEDMDFGTREFATLDLDGNLVTFFRWVT